MPLKKEIYWVIGVVTCSLLITLFLGINPLSGETVDLQLHDTYFVVGPFHFFTFVLISLLFLVYSVRAILETNHWMPKLILLVASLSLFLIVLYTRSIYLELNSGWVVYPPLSAMPEF